MFRVCGLLVGLALACEPDHAALPWLHGLTGAAIATEPTARGDQLMREWRVAPEPDCAANASTVLEVHADVAPSPGDETILASMAEGIVVLDAGGKLLASSPGYPCSGSVHEIEVLAAGDAGFLDPTIVVVATSGGHRERIAWLGLFRVADGRVDPAFAASVEEHRGEEVRRGTITLLPGALLYARPGGATSLWVFDPVSRAYIPPVREHRPHEIEPPVASVAHDIR